MSIDKVVQTAEAVETNHHESNIRSYLKKESTKCNRKDVDKIYGFIGKEGHNRIVESYERLGTIPAVIAETHYSEPTVRKNLKLAEKFGEIQLEVTKNKGVRPDGKYGSSLRDEEILKIRKTLELCKGNITKTAEIVRRSIPTVTKYA